MNTYSVPVTADEQRRFDILSCVVPDIHVGALDNTTPYVVILLILVVVLPGMSITDRLELIGALAPILLYALARTSR